MSEQIRAHTAGFEQYYPTHTVEDIVAGLHHISLNLGDIAMRFAAVERVPRYTAETRENDAEHSYMLALVATEIAAEYFPHLDNGLITQFSIVHDLLELETESGDVATFGISDEQLAAKAAAEHAVLDRLLSRLPRKTGLLLQAYEEQDLPEARFVRLIDKFMPLIVDILGPGSQVMHEDYATYSLEQLVSTQTKMKNRFEAMFPEEMMRPLHIARNSLARQFEDVFVPARYVQDPFEEFTN